MAINFPDSPGIGSVFTDSTSGFSYEWTGSLWKSFTASSVSNIQRLDDISGSFDNSETTFNLTVGGAAAAPANAQQLEIILGGIQQSPIVDYTVSSSTVTFTTAPANGLTFSGKLLGTALSLNTIPADTDGSGLTGLSTNLVSAIGIQSGGTAIGSGITQINFVGTGNTFKVTGTTVDISIEGGGGGGGAGVSSTGILTCRGVANADDITESITLDDFYGDGTNYAMVGPITVVGSAVTVTVGSGVSYVII